MFYAALITSCVLLALSVVGVVIIIYKLAGGPPEYGVVVVKTEPPGATVRIDGEDVGPSPAQASVPKDASFSVEVALPGYDAPEAKQASLEGKDFIELPPVILVKTESPASPR